MAVRVNFDDNASFRAGFQFFSNVNLELFGKDTGPVEGVITKLYRMNDEDSWNHAALVENSKQNKAWYIRLNFEPDEKLLGARVKCGLKVNARGNMSPKITVTKWSDTKVSRS